MNILIAISVFALTFSIITLIGIEYYDSRHRLVERLKDSDLANTGKDTSSLKRWLRSKNKAWSAKTSETKVSRLQEVLDRSGLSRRYTPLEWQLLKRFLAIILALMTYILLWMGHATTNVGILGGLITYGLVYYVFRWVIILRTKSRTQEIQRALPFTLDLIMIGVQAGLSFDAAVLKVIEAQSNALTFEFEKFLKEVRMGIVRRAALRGLMHRVDLEDFRTVVQAVIQADELGASLAQVLKVQSDLMRYKRKMKARERAVKAPVKMLFPLIFFIFPTIFVIILGPAVIQMAAYFFK